MKREFSSEEIWRALDREADWEAQRRLGAAQKADPELARRVRSAEQLSRLYASLPAPDFGEAETRALLGRLRAEDHVLARRGVRLGRPWAAVAATLLLAALLYGAWLNLRGAELGRWTLVEGQATLYRADGRRSLPLSPHTPFYRNDRLLLGARSVVRLALLDGSRVELEGPADFACVAWSDSAREFQMPFGLARYEVEHDPARPFRVHVDRETITVTGTRFIVRAER